MKQISVILSIFLLSFTTVEAQSLINIQDGGFVLKLNKKMLSKMKDAANLIIFLKEQQSSATIDSLYRAPDVRQYFIANIEEDFYVIYLEPGAAREKFIFAGLQSYKIPIEACEANSPEVVSRKYAYAAKPFNMSADDIKLFKTYEEMTLSRKFSKSNK